VDATPVWFMRQAGRYMEVYRRIRAAHGMLEICHTPRLAAEVTLQPIERLDVDAAILFADILLPLEALGVGLEFAAGDGPVIARPVRGPDDLARLRDVDVESDLGYVGESVRAIVAALGGRVPLIGFAGGPFTVASYLVEGGSSRSFVRTKRLMYEDPQTWNALLARLSALTLRYLEMQLAAGADAVQLFDSWVGMLSPDDYRRHVQPHSRTILAPLVRRGVPVIHFGTQTGGLLRDLRDAGGSVIGVDWRRDLGEAWDELGAGVAVQGNLDPVMLFAPRAEVDRAARSILERAGARPGHVFNLGHGILPETPEATVRELVGFVREESARIRVRASRS
jgi:uroporphyrinogen decarboxylase